MKILFLIAALLAPPVWADSLSFTSQTSGSAFDRLEHTWMPAGFGDGDFSVQFWIQPASATVSDCSTEAEARSHWCDADPAHYSSANWWWTGNFLLDGHNNTASSWENGTLSIQIVDSAQVVRVLFGDGTEANARTGELHAVSNTGNPLTLIGDWHHVAFVRDCNAGETAATLYLYIDGVEVDTETTGACTAMYTDWWDDWSGFPAAQQGWYWGVEKQAAEGVLGYYEDYKGLLDEIGLHTEALTQAQITALQSNRPDLPDADIPGYWGFFEGSGTTVENASGTSGSGTLVNGAWSATERWTGDIFYVETTGDNGDSGVSEQSPWATVAYAASQVAAGDTVIIGAGTYSGRVLLDDVSGTAAEWITFRAAAGDSPVIEYGSEATFEGTVEIRDGSSYILLDGLAIQDSAYWNLLIYGPDTHHITVQNCTITGSTDSNLWIETTGSTPTFIRILNNTMSGSASGGITVWRADGGYLLIDGNEVFGNTAAAGNYDGIQIGGQDAAPDLLVVRDNVVYNNATASQGSDQLDVGGHDESSHRVIEGNVVYSPYGEFKVHSGDLNENLYYTHGVSGMQIVRYNHISDVGLNTYGFPNPLMMYNNTFMDAGRFIFFWKAAPDNGGDWDSYGDTTYEGTDLGRLTIKNNIFWQEGATGDDPIQSGGPDVASLEWEYSSMRLYNNYWKLNSDDNFWWDGVNAASTPAGLATMQASNSPDFPFLDSVVTNSLAHTSMFQDYAMGGYQLAGASPAIDQGAPLTFTVGAGFNSTSLELERASAFSEGMFTGSERLVEADWIVITPSDACDEDADFVQVYDINFTANIVTLETAATWGDGENAYLFKDSKGRRVLFGCAPDIGAYEYVYSPAPEWE